MGYSDRGTGRGRGRGRGRDRGGRGRRGRGRGRGRGASTASSTNPNFRVSDGRAVSAEGDRGGPKRGSRSARGRRQGGRRTGGDDRVKELPPLRPAKVPTRSDGLGPVLTPLWAVVHAFSEEYPLDEMGTSSVSVTPAVFGKSKSLLQACVFHIKDLDVGSVVQMDGLFEMIYWVVCWMHQHKTDRLALTENLRDSLYPFMRTLSKFCRNRALDSAARGAGRLSAQVLASEIDSAVKLAREDKKRRQTFTSKRKVGQILSRDHSRLTSKLVESYHSNCLTEEEAEQLDEIQLLLSEQVENILGQAELVRFGSAANGLASRGSSDLDVALVNYDVADVRNLAAERSLDYKDEPDSDANLKFSPSLKHAAAVVLSFIGDSLDGESDSFRSVVEEKLLKARQENERTEPLRVETLAVRILGKLLEEPFHVEEIVDSARVPIVKAVHVPTGTECDLAAGNEIAVYNTELLKMYADFDERVKPLIFAVKRWAKARGLGDASQGSLSSYAWVCLVIFFLQQPKEVQVGTKKNVRDDATSSTSPILPKLQVLSDLDPRKIVTQNYRGKADVEFDVSFRTDIEQVREELYSEHSEPDDATLGELLTRFFFFYGFVVQYEGLIVSIRTGDMVRKREHEYITKGGGLSIEDPFELEHDLSKFRGRAGNFVFLEELERAFQLCMSFGEEELADRLMEKQEVVSELGAFCWCCYSVEHQSRDCPDRATLKVSGCLFCGDKEHRFKQCPKSPMDVLPGLHNLSRASNRQGNGRRPGRRGEGAERRPNRRICKDWLNRGNCRYGASCKFLHTET